VANVARAAIIQNRVSKSVSQSAVNLDPPFNSNASYNVLFKAPSGEQSQAQKEAFEDTWHWTADNGAELAFDEVMRSGNTEAANMLRAIRSFLGENDMMAYLTMMAVRLIELHRVLKPSGSLYESVTLVVPPSDDGWGGCGGYNASKGGDGQRLFPAGLRQPRRPPASPARPGQLPSTRPRVLPLLAQQSQRSRPESWPSQIRILLVNAFYFLPAKSCED